MKLLKMIKNRPLARTAIIGGIIVIAFVTANTFWSVRQNSDATNEAVSTVSSFYLEAMAERRARIITNLINNNFDQMKKAVDFIADSNCGSLEEFRDSIGMVKSLLGLNRFALVDEDDIVYTQYTTYTGGSRHTFLSDVSTHDRIITTVSIYGSSKQLCLAIPISGISFMGKPFKACFVQLDIKEIVELLAFDDQGQTHFALYVKNGGNLSGTELGPEIGEQNIFEALKGLVSEEVWNENYRNFENELEGSIRFSLGGQEETLCYVPIQGTGWEMTVLIRDSIIQDQIRDVSERNFRTSRRQIAFTLVSVVALAVVLLLQLKRLSKEKLEEEKEASRAFQNMANTDSMTGVRNKHAYLDNEALIDSKIESGELKNVAVVLGDINGLKHVNDTYGHAAGDQLIKDACTLICEHFKQGAVFRIGGDEFAVILQGKGYETMHDVMNEFNRKVEENIKTGSVVVSIGYSVLEKDDHSLQEVFARADQMMYARKSELKAMGAKTR